MKESERPKDTSDTDVSALTTETPLVFISHDARDAELAKAFGHLLKSATSGMIKTFRSSDEKGTEGIEFGEEWYKRLMANLQSTSDVICLFTERSLDRPWILFEAGVAKGTRNRPVVGVALGVRLSRVSAGPFSQFQNMDHSEDALTKLVIQLARRVPALQLDAEVLKRQVEAFKTAEAEILKRLSADAAKEETLEGAEESPVDSTDSEYHEAIKNAQERVWLHQTWLPGIERDAVEILQSHATDIRILLASFKEGSPIYSRIAGRDLSVEEAKHFVKSSVMPFTKKKKQDCLRFSFGHHPGWIAIIDSQVFWGPTPVHMDNHANDFLFHKLLASSSKADIWKEQFDILWREYSHDFGTEMEYNELLRS